jgi:S-formylglutathione hydrolase FrmB
MRTISHWFIAISALLMLARSASPGTAQSRTARTIRIESAAIGTEATVAVLLPPDYELSTARYPVVYLLHGGTQNHTTFPSRAWFNPDVSKRRMIVVMPYLQPFTFSSRAGRPAPVEEFLGRELPAYIDANYRTVNDRRARAIAGISMGGYGATLLGLKRSDVFGAVGAISAALSTGGRPDSVASLVAGLTPESAAYFFVACGIADSVLPSSRELVTQLHDRQIRSELHEVPGGHDWSVWDSQVRAFFDVLAKLPGWRAEQ